jgi:hypothetical protein
MQQFHKYLTFMCGLTCFGRLYAHHQELTTALAASGFTVGALAVNAATTNAPTVKPEAANAVVSSW